MKIGFIGLGHMGSAMAASLLHDRFVRLFAQGGDKLDWSAIGGLATQDAGDPQAAITSSISSAH
jgi:3-hydroxyisobutyrate dehydrogenase-like beta-hydroxyacid dehydrogenase